MYDDPAYVKGFLGRILRASTIHGVKYIGSRNRHIVERIFWICSVLALVGYSLYLALQVYLKYHANPVMITLQPKATDIARVPFPAITICNVNILKNSKIQSVYDKLVAEVKIYRLHRNETTEVTGELLRLMILAEHLAHYCLAAPSFYRLINAIDVDDIVTDIQSFLEVSNNTNQGYSGGSFMPTESVMSKELRYNISMFGAEAAHSCNDMMAKCIWERKRIPCKEIFVPIQTQRGSCCVFNMMPRFILRKIPENESRAEVNAEKKSLSKKEIKEWKKFGKSGQVMDFDEIEELNIPRHQKTGGRPYGLSILLNPELDSYGSCSSNDGWGFKMLAHSPISFPNVMDYGLAIPTSSEVFVDVEPMISTADKSIKDIEIEKRGCYFPTDKLSKLKSYKFYSADNCLDECLAKITYENCSCVRYFMPRNSSQRLCGARKLHCAEEVRVNVTSSGMFGHCSECLPACTELSYHMQMSHFALRERDESMSCIKDFPGAQKELGNDYSIVHIYVGTNKIHAKERKRLYDASDLLANAGGLLSLTLGFSIASLVEVMYFVTFRLWFHIHDKEGEDTADYGANPAPEPIESKQNNAQLPSRPRIMDGLERSEKNIDNYEKGAKKAYGKNDLSKIRPRTPQFHLLEGSYEEPPPPYSYRH